MHGPGLFDGGTIGTWPLDLAGMLQVEVEASTLHYMTPAPLTLVIAVSILDRAGETIINTLKR